MYERRIGRMEEAVPPAQKRNRLDSSCRRVLRSTDRTVPHLPNTAGKEGGGLSSVDAVGHRSASTYGILQSIPTFTWPYFTDGKVEYEEGMNLCSRPLKFSEQAAYVWGLASQRCCITINMSIPVDEWSFVVGRKGDQRKGVLVCVMNTSRQTDRQIDVR